MMKTKTIVLLLLVVLVAATVVQAVPHGNLTGFHSCTGPEMKCVYSSDCLEIKTAYICPDTQVCCDNENAIY